MSARLEFLEPWTKNRGYWGLRGSRTAVTRRRWTEDGGRSGGGGRQIVVHSCSRTASIYLVMGWLGGMVIVEVVWVVFSGHTVCGSNGLAEVSVMVAE